MKGGGATSETRTDVARDGETVEGSGEGTRTVHQGVGERSGQEGDVKGKSQTYYSQLPVRIDQATVQVTTVSDGGPSIREIKPLSRRLLKVATQKPHIHAPRKMIKRKPHPRLEEKSNEILRRVLIPPTEKPSKKN